MTNENRTGAPRLVVIAGLAGLIGAIGAGAGEFLMQFNPQGGYEAAHYEFFAAISDERLRIGYFIAGFSAPVYVAGYLLLANMREPAGKLLSNVFFLLGAYAFIVGAVWLGQRVFLAFTVHEIADGAPLGDLLNSFAALNEPLVNVLRVVMALVSVIWVLLILRGRTRYPRWMALFCPAILVALIFGLYAVVPSLGAYLLPNAMNVAHIVLFALSLLMMRRAA